MRVHNHELLNNVDNSIQLKLNQNKGVTKKKLINKKKLKKSARKNV